MLAKLEIGEKVLVFYHPLHWDKNYLDLDYHCEGIVTEKYGMGDGRYFYKVKSGNMEFEGLHGKISSDDYYFVRKSEYIEYLRNIIRDLNNKKQTCMNIISELEGRKK